MNHPIRKKLIEVALPLEAINEAASKEKSIRQGHPSTLHLWWARRPLAAARAVIFAQMVDDPSAWPDLFPTEKAREKERQRLFRIIEELVKWENTTNKSVINQAKDEIWRSWRRACAENVDHAHAKRLFDRDCLPGFHDPFAGGGALPLEAQRLGLDSIASDLNPVAVLINKAMIELPSSFSDKSPVNGETGEMTGFDCWSGAQGLSEDIRYYGAWLGREAEKRIGHLYPKVEITPGIILERPELKRLGGKKLTVVAWLWARTVKSPNPAYRHVDVPLASTFMLSTKAGKEVYVTPVVDSNGYQFRVQLGKPPQDFPFAEGTKAGKGQDFMCLMSGVPIERSYIRDEGKAGRLGSRLIAVVLDGDPGRIYLSPDCVSIPSLNEAELETVEDSRSTFLSGATPTRAMLTGGVCSAYGLETWGDLFTSRQVLALTTIAELLFRTREKVEADAVGRGWSGEDAALYSRALETYLGLALGKSSDYNSSMCS